MKQIIWLMLLAGRVEGQPLRVPKDRPSIAKNTALRQTRLLEQLSPLATNTLEYLFDLCADSNGEPNPRVTCTAGNGHTADYIEQQMRDLGLTPLGDSERTTFRQKIQHSVHETYCPYGIQNLIGMIPGTEFPDQYVVYCAHFDGPNNDNPQTERTRNNKGIDNAYDNGLAVALGLAMARELVNNPPSRSVVLLFDDGEEGWNHVGVRNDGETSTDVCKRFVDSEWFRKVYGEIAGGQDFYLGTTCPTGGYLGARYWVRNPTVDLRAIQMLYVIDPLGSPYNRSSNVLAAIGGSQTNLGDGGQTANDYLDQVWPNSSSTNVELYKIPRPAVAGYGSSIDAFQQLYTRLCDSGDCLPGGGVPGIWLTQSSFQKYHGGSAITTANMVFSNLFGEGMYPSTAYFHPDNLDGFYLARLDDVAAAIYQMLVNTAESHTVSSLMFDSGKTDFHRTDVDHLVEMTQGIHSETQQLPPSMAIAMQPVIDQLREQASSLIQLSDVDDSVVNSNDFQRNVRELFQLGVGLFVSLDLFNDGYPYGEPFLDQAFATGKVISTEPPTPTSSVGNQGWGDLHYLVWIIFAALCSM